MSGLGLAYGSDDDGDDDTVAPILDQRQPASSSRVTGLGLAGYGSGSGGSDEDDSDGDGTGAGGSAVTSVEPGPDPATSPGVSDDGESWTVYPKFSEVLLAGDSHYLSLAGGAPAHPSTHAHASFLSICVFDGSAYTDPATYHAHLWPRCQY